VIAGLLLTLVMVYLLYTGSAALLDPAL
jgi:hypothetical protein